MAEETPEEKAIREALRNEADRESAPDSSNYTNEEGLRSILDRARRKSNL